MVNMIAAIGKSGQLGLNGGLPWDAPLDLALFKRLTVGSVIIVGGRTYDSLPNLPGRMVYRYSGVATPKDILLLVRAQHPGWPIWIAGGAKTYRDFAPYIDGLKVISVIDYDGPADTWFPFDAYGMPMPEVSVAQRIEHPPSKRTVAGSTPAGDTILPVIGQIQSILGIALKLSARIK